MTLDLLTPDGNVFSGDVYGVQLPGVTGWLEVLDKHAPMIAALQEGKLKVLQDKLNGNSKLFDIQGGFVEVLNNKVTVLVEGAKEA